MARLHDRIQKICDLFPGTLTTQQLDAVYVWKMTGHVALYATGTSGWLPSMAPLMTAGVLDAALSTPSRHKLSSQLERMIIANAHPAAAQVPTAYGGTGAPLRLATLPREMRQYLYLTGHMARKLDQVLFKGRVGRAVGLLPPTPPPCKPFITPEFRDFMDPTRLYSRALYAEQPLRDWLAGPDEAWRARSRILSHMATVEILCRELSMTPDAEWLTG